jgi:hypothetical protein
MKKFTLCALALSGVLLVSAGAPKKFTATLPAKSVDLTEAKLIKMPTPAKLRINDYLNVPTNVATANDANVEGYAKAARTVSRADEATSSSYNLLYSYPDGAFFPVMHLTYAGSEYYSQMGSVLIPADVDVTFPNYTYTYDETNGVSLLDDLDWSWTYYFGVYSSSYMYNYDNATTCDLTAKFTPLKIQSYQGYVPELVVGTDTISATWDYTNSSNVTTTYDMDLYIGGSADPNPGYGAYLDSLYTAKYNYSNIYYGAMLSNYNNADYAYSATGTVGAGSATGVFSDSYTGKTLREYYLGSSIENAGLSTDNFYGYTQLFSTGDAVATLSYLRFMFYIKTSVERSVTISLYKLNYNEEGTSMTLEQLYSAEQSFAAGTSGAQKFKIDLFDEETENEYLTLEPNGDYMIMLSGNLDEFEAFYPYMSSYENTIGKYTPEWFGMRGTVYAVYLTNSGTFSFISADMNFYGDSSKTSLVCYPTIGVTLGIEYPYITPMRSFTSTSTVKYVEQGSTEVDGVYFDYNNVKVGELDLFSNATAEELTASLEYSSDALKEALSVAIVSGSDFTSSSGAVTFTTAIRSIVFRPSATIPAGSWIKVSHKGATLKVNIPEYDAAGIGSVAADNEAVATQLYDLQGRKLVDGAKGIAIKQVKMADGSVKTTKVAL